MNDQEKSVLLAKAKGWYQLDEEPIMGARWQEPGKPNTYWINPPNLYSPANMVLAWRIHLWMIEKETGKRESPYAVSPKPYLHWWKGKVPWMSEDCQRLFLDKIFELEVNNGI